VLIPIPLKEKQPENVRQEPPRVIGVDGVVEVPRQLENEIAPETESVEAVEPVIVVKKEEITAPAPAGTEEVVAKVESPTVLPQVQTPVQPQEPDPIPIAAALEAVNVNEQTPAIETLPNTGAWIIQAASFVDEFKALDLRDKMRSRGYPAFISTVGVTIAGVDSVRFRVKVGPLTDRTVIDQRRREIARLTGAEPLVMVGMVRGFARECLSLLVWVVAITVTILYSRQFATLLPSDTIETGNARLALAALSLFIGCLLIGRISTVVLASFLVFCVAALFVQCWCWLDICIRACNRNCGGVSLVCSRALIKLPSRFTKSCPALWVITSISADRFRLINIALI